MKPKAKLVGENGNIFNLLAIASKALKRNGLRTEAKEMQAKVFASKSYDAALGIILEYVDDGEEE